MTPRDLWMSVARMVGIVLGMTLMYTFMPLYGPRWWLGTFAGIGSIVALLPLTIRRTAAIVNSDRPMFEMAEGMVLLLTMLVVGGSGSIPGVVVGVILIGLLPEVLRAAPRGLLMWQEFVYGLILILAIMFMPNGIWGIVEARARRKTAAAVKDPVPGAGGNARSEV